MRGINCIHGLRNCLLITNKRYTKTKIFKIKCYFVLNFSAFDFKFKGLCYRTYSALHFRRADSERDN